MADILILKCYPKHVLLQLIYKKVFITFPRFSRLFLMHLIQTLPYALVFSHCKNHDNMNNDLYLKRSPHGLHIVICRKPSRTCNCYHCFVEHSNRTRFICITEHVMIVWNLCKLLLGTTGIINEVSGVDQVDRSIWEWSCRVIAF